MPDAAFTRYAAPTPTPYHRRLTNLLARRNQDLFDWFASEKVAEEAASSLGLEIRRRACRLEPGEHPDLYRTAREIGDAMGVSAPVSLYQGDAAGRARNAALFFDPAEAHLVLSGDLLRALSPAELRFTLGHELAHHRLWTLDDGKYWTAHRMLGWINEQPNRPSPYLASARLERLYTEVFADRYGLWAVGDLDPALSAQVKVSSGQEDVSAAAYLAQAEEALEATADPTARQEHHLRAALLAAWAHDPDAAEIRAHHLIEAGAPIDRLDLLAQEGLSDLTHGFLAEFLSDPWRGREAIRSHAATLSPLLAETLTMGARPSEPLDGMRAQIKAASPSVQEYLAFLLLDFATVDPEIDEMILAQALVFAGDFDLAGRFKELAVKELKTTRTKLNEIEKNAEAILARAESLLARLDADAPTPAPAPLSALRAEFENLRDGEKPKTPRVERRSAAGSA